MTISRPARAAGDMTGRQIKRTIWSGVLTGAGGFQLYDGLVQHKLLGLHQVRYHVIVWPYDLAWNLTAFVMIIAGAGLMTGRAGLARSAMFRSDADTAA